MALQKFEQEDQNSALSLTLDDFQCNNDKNFSSLNMDEFLASIWSSNDEDTAQTHNNTESVATAEHTISQQLGNSSSVPPPICKKTSDEVWSEIHKNQPQFKEANNLKRNETLKKQETPGEMTFEDFLVKAGVVKQSSSLSFQNHSGNVSNNMEPLNIASSGLRPSMEVGFPTQCVTSNSSATYQMTSGAESSGAANRKRIIDGPPEVLLDRKQRRMMKNRESAARSRARKQAYTIELEAELNLLQEENKQLKQFLVNNTEIEYTVLVFFLDDLCFLMLNIYIYLNPK
ncbi:ABA response element-binding factor [Medicago truncatula]|uniref:ABA response element-binding factor n=1 Tax=Medicago truncatula TaxID=3880 RepID=A0A072VLG2_MEDTR|nr:ABA response element-binding factor [Medicago truncatula]